MPVAIKPNHVWTEGLSEGWLAEPKLVRRRQARLRVASRRCGAASFACNHERRMVDQNSASWNPLIDWLRQVDDIRRAA
jgi:hypothetical protein